MVPAIRVRFPIGTHVSLFLVINDSVQAKQTVSTRRFLEDVVLIGASIYLAIILVSTGWVSTFVASFGEMGWLGIFMAGMFFTSVFTTAPSIVLLSQFAETTHPLALAVVGGLGSVIGDYILYRFVRNRVSEDFEYLLSFPQTRRFTQLFKVSSFRYFAPFLGAVIIASPFPDEIGIALLGLSQVRVRTFLLISFVLSGAGIFVISIISQAL